MKLVLAYKEQRKIEVGDEEGKDDLRGRRGTEGKLWRVQFSIYISAKQIHAIKLIIRRIKRREGKKGVEGEDTGKYVERKNG